MLKMMTLGTCSSLPQPLRWPKLGSSRLNSMLIRALLMTSSAPSLFGNSKGQYPDHELMDAAGMDENQHGWNFELAPTGQVWLVKQQTDTVNVDGKAVYGTHTKNAL